MLSVKGTTQETKREERKAEPERKAKDFALRVEIREETRKKPEESAPRGGRITVRPHGPGAAHVTPGRWIGRGDWKPGFPHHHPHQMWRDSAEPAHETVRLRTSQTERGGRRGGGFGLVLFEGSFKGCL